MNSLTSWLIGAEIAVNLSIPNLASEMGSGICSILILSP
jgi:hypothetical protein